MALAKYRLKGHESFILREGWITKALFAIDRDPLLFTVSAGAVNLPAEQAVSLQEMLTQADEKLYEVKKYRKKDVVKREYRK